MGTTLGERVKVWRDGLGISQEEAGRRIGACLHPKIAFSQAAISSWENGTFVPDLWGIRAVAKAIGVSADSLIASEPIPAERFKPKKEPPPKPSKREGKKPKKVAA